MKDLKARLCQGSEGLTLPILGRDQVVVPPPSVSSTLGQDNSNTSGADDKVGEGLEEIQVPPSGDSVLSANTAKVREVRRNQHPDRKADINFKMKIQNQKKRHNEKFSSNFRDTVPCIKVCSGDTSQADSKYGGKPSCYGNSLAAACFEDPALWDSKDFRTVLDARSRLYDKMKNSKTTPHDYLRASDAKHLKGLIVVGKISTAFTLESEPFQGYLFADVERHGRFAPLGEALQL